jgi:hypothetical protein
MSRARVIVLSENMPVDVWCASTEHWSPGFRVVEAAGDSVRVSRVSDGQVLPVAFPVDDVRPSDDAHAHHTHTHTHSPVRRPL